MSEKALKTLTPAQYAFMRWLSETHPNLLAQAEDRRASLNGFMDSLTSVFTSITEKAPDLLNQYVTSKAQMEQLKLNIERAKRGEAPITQPLMVQASNTAAQVPAWVWGAGGAILVYLLLKK